MTFQDFENNVIEWAKDRDLLHYENHEKQYLKFVEEIGELARGIIKNDLKLTVDSIGDVAVTLVIYREQCISRFKQYDGKETILSDYDSVATLVKWIQYRMSSHSHSYPPVPFDYKFLFVCLEKIAEKLNLDYYLCIETAWNEIKDREGVTIDGNFYKKEKQECCLDSGQPCELNCLKSHVKVTSANTSKAFILHEVSEVLNQKGLNLIESSDANNTFGY